MKASKKILIGIILVIIAGIYYYIALPAANLHSSEAWFSCYFSWQLWQLFMHCERSWA